MVMQPDIPIRDRPPQASTPSHAAFRVVDRALEVGAGAKVALPFPVSKAMAVGDVIVVLVDPPAGVSLTENAFGVSVDGLVLWQIERIAMTGTDPNNRYTGLNPAGNSGAVSLFNWNGADVMVDVRTGRVISARPGK